MSNTKQERGYEMTSEQFSQLRYDLSEYTREISTKLEQIRCGIADLTIVLLNRRTCNGTETDSSQ